MKRPARFLAPLLVTATLASPALAQSAPGLDILFARLDADADGRISQAEVTAAKTRQFARADRDGDGQMTAEELAAIQARLARLQDAMAGAADRMDTDADGALTLAEYTARAPLFALLDIDGDGALSRAEADRAHAILQN